MKIAVIVFAVFLTLTTFQCRVAEGDPLKEAPQANGHRTIKPELRSLEFATLANARLHKEIIRQAFASRDAVLRQDGRVIAAWREVAWNENNKGGVRKQKSVFADDSSQTAQRELDRNGQKVRELLVVYPLPKLRVTGKYLTQAYRTFDAQGRTILGFSFDDQGGALFGRLTREYAPLPDGFRSRLAILINNQIYSAPQVNEPVDGGSGILDGQLTPVEIDELIKSLSHRVPQNNGEDGNEPPAVKALPKN
jgi:SecD/SecF fusion protein